MCGIAGTLGLNGTLSASPDILTKMSSTLVHRGPDEGTHFIRQEVGFAFRRLSIMDIANGSQPFFSEDGSIVAICNGEIYNYQDLRRELRAKGHSFRTDCDIEVLIPLYIEHGPSFLSKLNGQFAIAIYNINTKTLLLARDQVGICPLFYTQVGNLLVFASEIKAILAHPLVNVSINIEGLDQVLTYPGVSSPTTMFGGVKSLRPGHYLLAKANGDIRETEYWDLDYPSSDSFAKPRDAAEYVEEFNEILCDAVRLRLNADVPVGYYLSGGLDSSLIGAIAQHIAPNPSRPSFSIVFEDAHHDERAFQKVYLDSLPSEHHEVSFGAEQVLQRLKTAVYHSETPLKESYNTCSLALSESVRNAGVKVVLTGEGADELFAGYVGYRFDKMRRAGAATSRSLEDILEGDKRQQLWGNRDFFYEKDYSAFEEAKLELYSSAVAEQFRSSRVAPRAIINKSKIKGRHAVHQRSYVDFKLRLADHLLADHGDRVSYANSIEARYPFLDIRLVQLAQHMPAHLKLNGLVEKYIVKQVASRYLPAAIPAREKFHFIAPGSPELLARNVEWVNDLLSNDTIARQGYFNTHTIRHLKNTYSRPGFKLNLPFDTDVLMTVLTFGILLDQFGL